MAEILKDDPDWLLAAQSLADGLVALPGADQRVRLLERVCRDLGDQLYPAFVQILCALARFGDESTRRLAAETLAEALATGRLPAGPMPAWGGLGRPSTQRTSAWSASARSFGPVEFLVVWFAQQAAHGPLGHEEFAFALRQVLALVSSSPRAAQLYQAKLSGDIADSLEGAYTRATRAMLEQLLADWRAGASAPQIVQRLLDAQPVDGPFGRPAWPLP